MEKEEFPIGKVEYIRFKESFGDKIFYDGKQYKVLRTYTIKGYDGLLRHWDSVKVFTKVLPLSELSEKPEKSKEMNFIIKREELETLKKSYFKILLQISVRSFAENVFLTKVNNQIFMVDVSGKTHCACAPYQLGCSDYSNIETEVVSEIEISTVEKDALLKQGIPLFSELKQSNGKNIYQQEI
jgi:hypothetical protein